MTPKKRRKVVWYVVLIIFVTIWMLARLLIHAPLPDYNEDIKLDGITGTVEIYRDSFAIPHIIAENEKDLYTAVGFVMAQDRLWQMDLLRRVTTGRLAEILSDDLFEVDVLMRSLEMSKKSQGIIDKVDPELRECLLAFADGVNQFIAQEKTLPFEFKLLGYQPEPWEAIHSINLIGYMAWDLSTGWPNELTLHKIKGVVDESRFNTMIPNTPGHSTSIYPEFAITEKETEILTALQKVTDKLDDLGLDVFRGSNNWVVDGSKTTTGKPLLANDMHLGLSIPGVWYQMHHLVPGKLDVTGVVLPGQPLVVAGHNQDIAWGFTNVMTDGLDFYEETINPDNPNEYMVDGEWRKMTIKKEIIVNKSGESIEVENKFTHRGPVVSDIKAISGKTISMSWIGLLESNEMKTVYELNRAKNWEDFRNALRTFVSVNQNVVYADTEGNIGLQSTIGIPIREVNGMGVYPGDTSLYDWKGLVPFEELPFSFNPEEGFLSSANNRTVDSDYPYYISSWFDLPYRQDRIQEVLKSKNKVDINDFIALHANQTSKMAEKFVPFFINSLDKVDDLSASESEALDRLKEWDFDLTRKSTGATIFEYLYYSTCKELTQDELGEDLFNEFISKKIMVKNFMENILANPSSAWCNDMNSPEKKIGIDTVIAHAFKESLKEIGLEMGINQEKWEWGKVHQITLEHPLSSVNIINRLLKLSRGPYSVGGSHHTVSPYSYDLMDPSSVNHGASHRHIYDLSDWNNSLTIIPTGTSGIPSSRHYCDQTSLYLNNKYHSDLVSRDRIVDWAKYKMVISGK